MLKGVNRNVIVVRAARSSRFEAVYFVVKKGIGADRSDMIKEANRIISESGMSSRGDLRLSRVRCVLYGALAGGILASVLWFVGVFLL